MNCLQRCKNNSRCTRIGIQDDATYPGYCRFHINRFKEHKDVPDPIIDNLNISDILPAEDDQDIAINAQFIFPGVNDIQIHNLDNLINQNIDNRLTTFINDRKNDLHERLKPVPVIEHDDIIFQILFQLPQGERDFYIFNYERLFELIQHEVNGTPIRNNENLVNQPAGLINMILAALDPGIVNARVINRDNLNEFLKDEQNVHTKEVVNPVLTTAHKMITLGKKIPVSQDTFKEVVYECKLSDAARKQMCLMYYSDESIYNLEAPTYKLVLDGVWSFVLQQSDETKKDILFRMSQELEDNIGMCPQGNLSRLVNILSGFLEGASMEYKESIQDVISKLSKLEDVNQRMNEAKKALQEHKIPEHEWIHWLEALE